MSASMFEVRGSDQTLGGFHVDRRSRLVVRRKLRREEINVAYSCGIVFITEACSATAGTSSSEMSMFDFLAACWNLLCGCKGDSWSQRSGVMLETRAKRGVRDVV